MKNNIQQRLIEEVKRTLKPGESLGIALSDALSISTDAAYRRLRNETQMTVHEVEKVCSYFQISFDALLEEGKQIIPFDYLKGRSDEFSIEGYLEGVLLGIKNLTKLHQTKLYLVVNNVHFFQGFNFPELMHFRLFFWAKAHLSLKEFEQKKFDVASFSAESIRKGREILQCYNQIETLEVVDREMMRGYIRQIGYALESGWFQEKEQAVFLVDRVQAWLNHFMDQATQGKKFMIGNAAPAKGSKLTLFLNDTVNTDTTFYYEGGETKGVYLIHNILNYLHTADKAYVVDTKTVLDRQITNASLISEINHKERHKYFQYMQERLELERKEMLTK